MSRPRSSGLAAAFDPMAQLRETLATRTVGVGRPPNTPGSFWARVIKGEPDACWPWTGRCGESGHGYLSWCGPEVQAHRLAYALTYGPLEAGVVIRHRCDNPPCCNPAHLLAGTILDNNRDSVERGRMRSDAIVAWGREHAGAANVNAKLTDDLVRELRASWRAGESIKSIVGRTGLAVGTIHPMLHGKTWKHVLDGEVRAARDASEALANRAAVGAEASRLEIKILRAAEVLVATDANGTGEEAVERCMGVLSELVRKCQAVKAAQRKVGCDHGRSR